MLAAASNYFSKSSTLAAYSLHSAAPSPASSSTNIPSLSSASSSSSSSTAARSSGGKPLTIGLWKVLGATHKTTSQNVSVWVFEKKMLDSIKHSSGNGKEWVIEQLKKEATSLSRLRHPDILHMVEPLEETRSELTFVTETVVSSLGTLLASASGSSRSGGGSRPPGIEASGVVDLDEVEIQKGTLQIAKGLAFLHQQAKMVHLNISPDAILVNSKGDWKLSGLSLTTLMTQPDGTATRYVYPEVDSRLPPQVQWKLDYLAPEYALDNMLTPSSDLYALGCVLFALHMGGKPPFVNRGSMQSLRENAEGPLVQREYTRSSRWERCSPELKDLLSKLITRHPSTRLSLASLPAHLFFSSLAISTLNFLEPTTFASKPREEKATFLRGLVRVLPSFSERLKKGKILLSLLEEMKDPFLLPFILPNVFDISKILNKEEFSSVLPKLQPLFVLKDPPQNMLTLLEHLTLFEEKTLPPIFRENVMPLIYNALESEHVSVQEKALKAVPHLCEILDYGTVQNVLLVKIAILFTRTRILSVKVQTLECFRAMVENLDTVTLTTKLVPLLAKIKTKEPAVMMATLGVHETMGAKVGREAIATLVLPQLWAMSMGPLLNADQFTRFMAVIKSLGSRVEREHGQHLREVRSLEQQTASFTHASSVNGNGVTGMGGADGLGGVGGPEVDFETLVKGGGGGMGMTLGQSSTMPATSGSGLDGWGDDSWGDTEIDSALASIVPAMRITSGVMTPTSFSPSTLTPSSPSRPTGVGSTRLKARPIPHSSFNSSMFNEAPQQQQSIASFTPAPSASPSVIPVMQPTLSLKPTTSTSSSRPSLTGAISSPPSSGGMSGGPNYNISLPAQAPAQAPAPVIQPMITAPLQPTLLGENSNRQSSFAAQSSQTMAPQAQVQAQPQAAAIRPPPGWSPGLMQPTAAPKPTWGGGGGSKQSGGGGDWGDFDPLK